MIATFIRKIKQKPASRVLTAAFLIFIFYVGSASLPKFLQTLQSTYENGGSLRDYIQNSNHQYEALTTAEKENPPLLNLGSYANFNGLLARILNQPMMNERVRLRNGHLSAWVPEAADPAQISEIANNIASISRRQTDQGKHFLFVLTPGQVCKYEDLLPAGYTDTTNATADALLEALHLLDVPYLDLRERMHVQNMTHEEVLFITDHHWTPEAGFWAYEEILKELAAADIVPPVESFYTDTDNYQFQYYKNCFLGSSGKRTGRFYGGLDDFCVISPKYHTNITVTYPTQGLYYEGPFAESVNNPYPESYFTDPDHYNRTLYDLYGRSDSEPVLRINADAPLKQKMLLIGDSFTNVPFSFLSLYNESCFELDMRLFHEDFSALYEEYAPDTVILMINATGCLDTNATYPFFE